MDELLRQHFVRWLATVLLAATIAAEAAPPSRDSKVPPARRPPALKKSAEPVQNSKPIVRPTQHEVRKVAGPAPTSSPTTATAPNSSTLDEPRESDAGAAGDGPSSVPLVPEVEVRTENGSTVTAQNPASECVELGQAGTLDLQTVLDSVYTSYPLLEIAILERVVKQGAQIAALGEFDLKLKAESVSAPIGFYRNYRNLVGVEQPLWRGGQFDAGYRTGHGTFEPWYGGRETDEGGEYRVGLYVPWIRNRRIDDRRAELFKRQVDRNIVEPFIQSEFLEFIRQSSIAYWGWTGAGQVLKVNRRLLSLSQERTEVLEELLKNQRISSLLMDDNKRLIATRQGKVVQSEQKVRESAIKLSLFLRSVDGRPYIARPDQLLADFPPISDRSDEPLDQDIQTAWGRRPELYRLNLDRQRLDIEFQQARNLYLPQVDSFVNVKDGLGQPASTKEDKSPLALETGVIMSVPYQRRKGIGKMQEVRGKLSQVNLKIQFQRDKIATEVQSAVNDLLRAYERVNLAREAVRLSEELAEAERERFRRQRADYLAVNLREDAVANAQIVEIEALFDYFVADANLRFALAMDIERIARRGAWATDPPPMAPPPAAAPAAPAGPAPAVGPAGPPP